MRGVFKLGRFSAPGRPAFAAMVVGEQVFPLEDLSAAAAARGLTLGGDQSPNGIFEQWADNFPVLQRLAGDIARGGPNDRDLSALAIGLEGLEVLLPLQPRQIFCAGANYRKHVVDLLVDRGLAGDPKASEAELRANAERIMDVRAASGRPFVFIALPSALVGPYDTVELPYDVAQPDWELELAVVIGRSARRVSRAEALDHVAGYTIANDITARDLVARPDAPGLGADWMAAKGSPSFLPIGPYVVPAAFVGDPQNLGIKLKLNGQVMQDESTADMIYSVAQIIEHVSRHVRLLPGDVICTGSPAGNGSHFNRFLQDGDVIEGEITGLGKQRNLCVAERQAVRPAVSDPMKEAG